MSFANDRPAPAGEASVSGKENSPMIAMPVELWNEISGTIALLAQVVKRHGSKEEVTQDPPAPKEWLSAEEAGEELNRSAYQIRLLCRKKVFGQKDSGGKWWIHRKDIENFRNGRTLIHGEVF
jgi:hypothetical protein